MDILCSNSASSSAVSSSIVQEPREDQCGQEQERTEIKLEETEGCVHVHAVRLVLRNTWPGTASWGEIRRLYISLARRGSFRLGNVLLSFDLCISITLGS